MVYLLHTLYQHAPNMQEISKTITTAYPAKQEECPDCHNMTEWSDEHKDYYCPICYKVLVFFTSL